MLVLLQWPGTSQHNTHVNTLTTGLTGTEELHTEGVAGENGARRARGAHGARGARKAHKAHGASGARRARRAHRASGARRAHGASGDSGACGGVEPEIVAPISIF